MEKYDENADGNITLREFGRAMASLKMQHSFTKDNISQLFDCLDKRLNGMISIDMLIRHLQWYEKHRMRKGQNMQGAWRDTQDADGNNSAFAVLFRKRSDIKAKIVEQQLSVLYKSDSNLFDKLRQEFKRMDVTRSGDVSVAELIR